jgi:hypothetical protein
MTSYTIIEKKDKEDNEELNNVLLEAIDETLKEVFKEIGANVIYNFLENSYHLNSEEIAEKSEIFANGLDSLLGSGASVVEKLILENLYHKLELEYEEKESLEFSNCIKKLRRKGEC